MAVYGDAGTQSEIHAMLTELRRQAKLSPFPSLEEFQLPFPSLIGQFQDGVLPSIDPDTIPNGLKSLRILMPSSHFLPFADPRFAANGFVLSPLRVMSEYLISICDCTDELFRKKPQLRHLEIVCNFKLDFREDRVDALKIIIGRLEGQDVKLIIKGRTVDGAREWSSIEL